jgi:hypothetical protein
LHAFSHLSQASAAPPPTRRGILASAGLILAAGGITAATPENSDADLLALCARLEPLRRKINSMWTQGCGPRYWVPTSYIVDDEEREAVVVPLEDEESSLINEMLKHPPTTVEGIRGVMRYLALSEAELRKDPMTTETRYFSLSSQGETIMFWLVESLNGGEIRPDMCMTEPGQLCIYEGEVA